MTRRAIWLLALVASVSPAAAEEKLPGAIEWLFDSSNDPGRRTYNVGSYALGGSGIVAMDPLAPSLTASAPTSAENTQIYTVLMFEDGYAYNAALVLVTDNAMPDCGESLGIVGVDTGLIAITSETDRQALAAYADKLDTATTDLFTELEPQLPMEELVTLVTLPGGERFPVAATGGDGGFQLFRLDAQGEGVAYYLDFVGDLEGEWIEPPPCAKV